MTSVTINEASNLLGFLEAWSDPDHERNHIDVEDLLTPDGRITELHDPAPGRGPLVTRHHPRFKALLEPGVRDLVLRLVTTWNLVTYSSCEGHRLPDGRIMPWCIGALDLSGVAPRLFAILQQHCEDLNGSDEMTSLNIGRGELRSGATTFPFVELRLHPAIGVEWHDYVAARDRMTEMLCRTEEHLTDRLGRA